MRNLPIEIHAAEKYPHNKNRETIEKSKSTQYLTRFGNLSTSSRQRREILLIQQSIQENTRGILQGIQFMRALIYIYSQRVP